MAAGTCSPCWHVGFWALDPQHPAPVLISSGGQSAHGQLAHARLLAEFGPNLGRPTVDTLKGSRHTNMKELRFCYDEHLGTLTQQSKESHHGKKTR
ncbi:hypothetical protein GALL_281970 [mine drainage metagenome]|uniref:Uncharacterized protein n=1 Tax=mine drainage metagenome TaxID=410659 RepID=A0A1J5R1Q0_9ZZZZ